ncbi:MAG: hypothetical protein J7M38_12740, partial [Armatimonadetes bacterium]|nr:hypothetical protein [Armatimonadota bacterium]
GGGGGLGGRLGSGKGEDGQLDNCPLTFADLTAIKRSFVNTLVGMFHQRIRYPDQLEEDEEERDEEDRKQQEPVSEAGAQENGS